MNIVYIIFTAVLVVSVIIGTYIHASSFKYATEGSASMLLGTAITGFISMCYYFDTGRALTPSSLRLPDAVFFQVLLPPIIFYAGFSVKKRMFFRNFAIIFTFGFFGTLTSAAAVSAAAAAVLKTLGMVPGAVFQSALALGAICACSDTVAILQIMDQQAYPVLHSLVFGEGIVNDAVGIVLLSSVHKLASHHTSLTLSVVLELLLSFVSLFVSSLLLGVAVGLVSALMVRGIFAKRHDCDREVLLLALLGYLSYLLADAFELSAILSVFFCGVTMSHYTWHSLSPAAQALALHTFRLASGLMEMILYAYSGINIWTSALWQAGDSRQHLTQALSLASILLLAVVIARVSFIYPAAAAASWIMAKPRKHTQKVLQDSQQHLLHPQQQQHHQGRRISMLDATVMMWGGLCRGAITLALAYHHFSIPTSAHQVMVVAVVLVVLVSSVVLGTVTGPLMEIIMTSHKQQQHNRHEARQQHQQQHLTQPLLSNGQQQPHLPRSDDTMARPIAAPPSRNNIWHGSSALISPFSWRRSSSSSSSGLGSVAEGSRQTSQEPAGGQQLLGVGGGATSALGSMAEGVRDSSASPGAAVGDSSSTAGQQITTAATAPQASELPLTDNTAGTAGRGAGRTTAAPRPATAGGVRRSRSSLALWPSRIRRSSLPSMDELTEYTRQQELDNLRSLAAASIVQGQQQQQQQGPSALSHISEATIRQQLQRLQLSSYASISGTAAADLPFVRSPSEVNASSLGTYLALSRSGSLAASGSVHGQQWLQQQQQSLEQQEQQQQRSQNGTAQPAAASDSQPDDSQSGAAQQQQQQQQRDAEWYIQQQLQLLQQIAQLQQEHQQLRQQQHSEGGQAGPVVEAVQSSIGWHDLHGLWRRFDKRYLQPVFGGREVARLTSAPSDFEHFV